VGHDVSDGWGDNNNNTITYACVMLHEKANASTRMTEQTDDSWLGDMI
jgi:hypothetical protein